MTVDIRHFEFSFRERRSYRLDTHAMSVVVTNTVDQELPAVAGAT